MKRGIVAALIGGLCACAPQPTPTPTTAADCGGYAPPAGHSWLVCAPLGQGAWLLQTYPAEQLYLEGHGAGITLSGTMVIQTEAGARRFTVLEGTAVIAAPDTTRVLRAGAQIVLAQTLGEPIPYDTALLDTLAANPPPRPIAFPSPIAAPPWYTPPPSPTATSAPLLLTSAALGTPIPTPCHPRDDWSARYSVRAGDTLSGIAARHNLSLAELQAGNCLDNPNRLSVGLVLRVPPQTPPSPTPPPTGTPSAIAYRADDEQLSVGDCTTIRWDVYNVQAVFFDAEEVPSQASREVCPAQTTTYTLTVIYPDASQSARQLTITVQGR